MWMRAWHDMALAIGLLLGPSGKSQADALELLSGPMLSTLAHVKQVP